MGYQLWKCIEDDGCIEKVEHLATYLTAEAAVIAAAKRRESGLEIIGPGGYYLSGLRNMQGHWSIR